MPRHLPRTSAYSSLPLSIRPDHLRADSKTRATRRIPWTSWQPPLLPDLRAAAIVRLGWAGVNGVGVVVGLLRVEAFSLELAHSLSLRRFQSFPFLKGKACVACLAGV